MGERAIVVGAGIVGLHVANALSEAGFEVYVLERDATLGEQSSGRNSGVIHAGIFYESGSLKEKSCIEGNRLTYEWLGKLDVAHRPCGKFIMAELGQEDELVPFFEHLRDLPIPEPAFIEAARFGEMDAPLRQANAILVPSTGIVDAAAYVKALAVYLEQKGCKILMRCEVLDVSGQLLKTTRGEIEFDVAINSAGLFADHLSALAGLSDCQIKPCRGDYFITSECPLNRPLYHLPYRGAQGLGVHLTPTLDNQMLIGPNAFFIEDKLDYKHCSSVESFEQAIQYYLPKWEGPSITPAYSGNRPKLFLKGDPISDFTIIDQDPWVHLLGIESPGLTAAPALARQVAAHLK